MAAACRNFALLGLLLLAGPVASVSPIDKVISLLGDLEAKITAAGEAEEAAFKEYFEWCDNAARNSKFALKTATTQQEEASATISKTTADAEAAATSISDLAASIAQSEDELKKATAIRGAEHADFAKVEAELVEGIEMLDRAIEVIQKEMDKNPALLQQKVETSNVKGLLKAIGAVIDGAAFGTSDREKLLALVQSRQAEEDGDAELGAPDAATYKSHSTGIVDVLEDMKEKAEGELSEARKAESAAKHNFEMLKQSLTDQINADTKDKAEATAAKATAEETKAGAEGDLSMATKDIASANSAMSTVGTDCMTAAADHEASVNGRTEELKALATAKKIILESTSGAADKSYSLLQVNTVTSVHSSLSSAADLAKLEVVTAIKRLAKQEHSSALAQLASRIAAVVRFGAASGEDPFAKVKGLITDMIARLQKEAASEASQKAYCDEEMAKNADKKAELSADVSKMSAKIDSATSKSAELKSQVAEVQKELADMAREQSDMDRIRKEENAAYLEAKADLEQGITGVQGALEVLREYYGGAALLQQPAPPTTHKAEGSAGGSIINILEVCESDFSKNLAAVEMEESEAQTTYDARTQENKVTKKMKDSDVKYMTAEAKSLDKTVSELSSDRNGVQTELAAVLEYSDKLDSMCVAKPETYEEKKARREAEIAGLKEALTILEGQAMFVQRPRRLRGVSAH